MRHVCTDERVADAVGEPPAREVDRFVEAIPATSAECVDAPEVPHRDAGVDHRGECCRVRRDDQVAAKTSDDEDEEEEVITPELDAVIDDPVLAVDDDDEDAAEPGPAVSEDLGEFTDEEEVEDDADVPFLEDEDDDEFDDSEIEGLPDEGGVDD